MAIDLLSVTEVAHRLRLTPARVRRFIAEDRLKAEDVGGRYVIHKRDFDKFESIPRRAGKPPEKSFRR
jgi:excisionase family DNA binding protein